MDKTYNLTDVSNMFRAMLLKQIGIVAANEVEAVTGLSVREEGGVERLYVNYVMCTEEGNVPMERRIEEADADVSGVLFFNNLSLIRRLLELTDTSPEWRETFVIRILETLPYVELIHAAGSSREDIEEFLMSIDSEDDDAEQEAEVVVFDRAMIPRYNSHGFVVSEELLVAMPVELGSDGKPHYIKTYPVVMYGNRIAINQHVGAEILATPRVEANPEYHSMRTGKTAWATNGYAVITKMPTFDMVSQLEGYGRGIGDDGIEYSLSLAGAAVANNM